MRTGGDKPVIEEVDESTVGVVADSLKKIPLVGKHAGNAVEAANFFGNGIITSILGIKNPLNPFGIVEGAIDGIRGFFGFETGSYVLSHIIYTPKMIFSGEITLLKTNFFTQPENGKSVAANLKHIIATWYYALRNIALVFMLIMLVYTGIKIMITSVAGDRAKYKEMITNWIVGICLILFIHYFMVFMVKVNDTLVNMIANSSYSDDVINYARMVVSDESKKNSTVGSSENSGEDIGLITRLGYGIVYTVMVMYTLIFTWQYLKRVVKLAYLILFAPLIAVTYPIDKMADGQAQGFNAWIKDFIFTLLIQPLHLLLYTVLIGSVSELANKNIIYTLVALGSLIPLEGMLRNYLGFGRAKDAVKPPNPAGLLAMSGLLGGIGKKLLPSNVKESSGYGGNGPDSGGTGRNNGIKLKGNDGFDLIGGGSGGRTGGGSGGNIVGNAMEGAGNAIDQGANVTGEAVEKGSGLLSKAVSTIPVVGAVAGATTNVAGKVGGAAIKAGGKVAKVAGNLGKHTINGINKAKNTKAFQAAKGTAKKLASNAKNSTPGKNIGKFAIGAKDYAKKNVQGVKTFAGDVKQSNLGKGMGAIGKKYVRKLTNGKTGARGALTAIGKIAKGAAKVGVGATLGTAGLIGGASMGITSGDASKAFQYAATGAIGGYALGSKTTKNITNRTTNRVNELKDTYKQGADPEKYKADKIFNSVIDNPEAMDKFKEKNKHLSEKQIYDGIRAYANEGISDPEDIQKGFDLEQKAEVDRSTAMGAIKLSKQFDIERMTRTKDGEERLRESLKDNYEAKGYSNADEEADKSLQLMKMTVGAPMRKIKFANQEMKKQERDKDLDARAERIRNNGYILDVSPNEDKGNRSNIKFKK